MAFEGVCLNCFCQYGDYEVCPYCGYVKNTPVEQGFYLRPGSRLWGRYVVGTVLGTGGFGLTYKAFDTRLQAVVAIKEFFPQTLVARAPGESAVRPFSGENAQHYRQQLARFLEEARQMAKFSGDQHIVSVLDFFEENGTAYIVMEYLAGKTLKQQMLDAGDAALPQEQAVFIAVALLSALKSIHKMGILHRDISPDNLFLLENGGMKVLDFGAARFAPKEENTMSMAVVVKKGYTPPEQYRQNMKQGVWTDLYAAGATLYKMLTGQTPEESIQRVEQDLLQSPRALGVNIDPPLDKVVMKSIALRHELRFQSAEAMLAAIENRTSVLYPEEELKRRRRRGRLALALSALLVAGMLGFAANEAANRPATMVASGPSLADMKIEPDTITLLLVSGEELQTAYTQLAEAFMAQYPEHKIQLEFHDGQTFYTPENQASMLSRFQSGEAPALFDTWITGMDYEKDFCDLSPLYNALPKEELLLLEEIYDSATRAGETDIYEAPTGFVFQVARVDSSGLSQRNLPMPTAIDSYEELVKMELEAPHTVRLGTEVTEVLDILKPEIASHGDLDTLKTLLGEFAERYESGYFGGHDLEGNVKYPYSNYLFTDFVQSFPANLGGNPETGTIIPLVNQQGLPCQPVGGLRVSAHITENQQRLAMLFLRFLYSERGQDILYVQNGLGQPLHKKTMERFIELNPGFSFLNERYKDKLYIKQGYLSLNGMWEALSQPDARKTVEAMVEAEYGERWRQ